MNAMNSTFGKLDAMDYDELFRHVTADIDCKGNCFSSELVEVLDTLFSVKLVRLLRAPATPVDAFYDLDDLIARIARDSYESQLNAFPEHYASRWKALRYAITLCLRIHEADSEQVKDDPYTPLMVSTQADPWELVAEQVLLENQQVTWGSVRDLLKTHEVGPQSGGGVSQLLASMRAHGWIDSVPLRGNKSVLIPGKNISKSRAWLSRQDAAYESSASISAVRRDPQPTDKSWRYLHKFAEFARKGTSFNQAALLDFMHVAHEHHREMRLALDELEDAKSQDSRRLLATVLHLNEFLCERTEQTAQQNFELLRQYFHDRNSVAPRMSIIVNWQREDDDDILTRAVARDSSVDYGSEARVVENSGFKHVIHTGTYYLNNDIPSAILEGSYSNPRFDLEYVNNLRNQYSTHAIDQHGGVRLSDWERIWKDGNSSMDSRSCYKSTLIIPLALRHENLSQEFRTSLKERFADYVGENSQTLAPQLIFGFLCFDHPRVEYFNSEEDIEVAHIFGSLLSMYLFKRIMLTNLSTTYKKALSKFTPAQRRRVAKALRGTSSGPQSATGVTLPNFELSARTQSDIFRLREVSDEIPH
ncbi:hypothetical protein [Duganella violaceipulchra]|uniref:Uncharacterized protein n=1 Tax=Duganella violaceipulchra TaxID=2849652 RepID=A0AA41L7W0_9BURK|nr:hypothetical protein [Duganella violaceicalia]MBV6321625.1 hypothetical protein [Duganella violaceicalia]MCP2008115.1 hypothetical protein [Duganella violaceicalia]